MTVLLETQQQLAQARNLVQQWATDAGFNVLQRTKLVTAASELGRNVLVHGGGGTMAIAEVTDGAVTGLRLCFSDSGPGIADIERAMTDGFSTAGSLGLGLGGTRRLVSEFDLASTPGNGTRITITQWKRR